MGLWSGATSEDRSERTEQIVKFPFEAASRATRLTRPENRVILQIREATKLDGKGLENLSSPRAQRRVATRLIGSRAAPVGKDRRRVIQSSPSAVMARFACLRGPAAHITAHARWRVGQRLFRCGKPPPAAEPRTRAVNRPIQDRRRWGQNSAGKYPLISRPMQISTRVGVVQAICRPRQHSRVLSVQVRSREPATQAPQPRGREHKRCLVSKETSVADARAGLPVIRQPSLSLDVGKSTGCPAKRLSR